MKINPPPVAVDDLVAIDVDALDDVDRDDDPKLPKIRRRHVEYKTKNKFS